MSTDLHNEYRTLLDARLLEEADLPGWAEDLRRQALARFEAVGFPQRRDEDWKYTRVGDLARRALVPVDSTPGDTATLLEDIRVPGAVQFVLVDGRFHAEFGEAREAFEAGLLRPLSDAIRVDGEAVAHLLAGDATAENAFGALAAAFATDGAVLRVPADTELDQVIQIVHLTREVSDESTRLIPGRLLVDLGRHARAVVVESFVGDAGGAGVISHSSRVRVGEGAQLTHVRIQAEGTDSRLFANVEVDLGRDATYRSLVLAIGGRLSREDLRVSLNSPGAHADLAAVTLARDRQHLDHNTLIDHRVPDCTSDQLYKNVLSGQGRTVFHGKINVHPDAQRTAAFQLNQNLLLSDEARADTRPQLEIFADDVKCSHGATVGRLADEAVFYLQSRAIGPEAAGRLLVRGFALDVLERIADDGLRDWLEGRLDIALDRFL
ncbi:MAG: Fe-S cluster assembly protein SufD [Deltaproteobacteria bacterium]|nr:MAG: Fe-S cluster assembly protein SufD [Deltaproteobacteria bacterium]